MKKEKPERVKQPTLAHLNKFKNVFSFFTQKKKGDRKQKTDSLSLLPKELPFLEKQKWF